MKGFWLASLLLMLVACRHRENDGGVSPQDAHKADVTVLVQNHHWLDINIYMRRGSSRLRLGTVAGTNEKSFSISWDRLSNLLGLQLQADPVGSPTTLTTEVIAIRPGAVVEWVIEAGMRQASVSVY
jgi:hypothetical protein